MKQAIYQIILLAFLTFVVTDPAYAKTNHAEKNNNTVIAIQNAQSLLKERNFFNGQPTGICDGETVAAINNYTAVNAQPKATRPCDLEFINTIVAQLISDKLSESVKAIGGMGAEDTNRLRVQTHNQ